MQALFTRVLPRLSEVEEDSYAHRNLLPRIHLAIRRSDVLDFQHIEVLASNVEKSSLLPDLAYQDPRIRPADRQRERLAFMSEEEDFRPGRRAEDQLYVLEGPRRNVQATQRRPTVGRSNPPASPSGIQTRANPAVALVPPTNPFASDVAAGASRPAPVCWKCRKSGHQHSDCPQPRSRFLHAGLESRQVVRFTRSFCYLV